MHRSERLFKVALVISAVAISLIVGEVSLTILNSCPYPATVGHTRSENASLYGWGFGPGESIRIRNPDTRGDFTSIANSRGWRDKERKPGKLNGTYRILALGDSVTFGIVPAERIYSRILEEKLKSAGYEAEVITIGYGEWGTDQELEALLHDGIRYRPDLIVLQFSSNDISEIVAYWKNSKPFYYVLNGDGTLIRDTNPLFNSATPDSSAHLKEKIKNFVFHSAICRCLYRLKLIVEFEKPFPVAGGVVYKPTQKKIMQLQIILPFAKANEEFLKYLKQNMDKPLSSTELDKVIERSQLAGSREMILRVLEQIWFDEYWNADRFYPAADDKRSFGWRLYFKLVEEIQRIAVENGAKLVLFSATDMEAYEWDTSRFRVANDDETKRVYLQPNELLREFAQEKGIGFIPQRRKYLRWRNDGHPNIAGNEAMASDIFDYLTTDFARDLKPFQNRQIEKATVFSLD